MKVQRFAVGELEANCYIYKDEATGRCAVIDPGDTSAALEQAIEECGRDCFDYILLTHCHFDHVGGVARVKELTGAPVAIHEFDAPGLRDSYVNLSGMWGGPKMIYPAADVTFSDREQFQVGESTFTVLHTPGHTAGSCCYLTEGILFSGDTLFRESVGRTDFPGGDAGELTDSLAMLLRLDGDCLVYTGHYGPTTLSYEREYNPYACF